MVSTVADASAFVTGSTHARAYNPAMQFFRSKPAHRPLPRRGPARALRADHEARASTPSLARRSPAVARGHEDRRLRPRLLLGRREGLLADPGRRHDGRRLCRRPHAEPDLRGGLLRSGPATPRSCWSRTTRQRSRYEQLLKTLLGGTTTRPRACARATTSGTQYRSIIIVADDEQRAAAEASKAMYQEQLTTAGYGAITTEIVDARPTRSTTPRTTTSSTSTRIPRGYCPNHSTGVKLPDDFVVTPLQYVD